MRKKKVYQNKTQAHLKKRFANVHICSQKINYTQKINAILNILMILAEHFLFTFT